MNASIVSRSCRHRTIAALFLLVGSALAACSSGSSPSANPVPGEGASSVHGPFSDIAATATERYVGRRAPSALDDPAIETFTRALLVAPLEDRGVAASSAMPHSYPLALRGTRGLLGPLVEELLGYLHRSPLSLDRSTVELPACAEGSWTSELRAIDDLDLYDSATGYVIRIDFKNCLYSPDSRERYAIPQAGPDWGNGARLDGTVAIATTRKRIPADDRTRTYHLAFAPLTVHRDGTTFRVTGAQSWSSGLLCSVAAAHRSDLLMERVDTGESVLLEGFLGARVDPPEPPHGCRRAPWQLVRESNWFEGRILHSSHGAVEVSTPARLHYLWDPGSSTSGSRIAEAAPDGSDRTKPSAGEIVLNGAAERALRLRFELLDPDDTVTTRTRYEEPFLSTLEVTLLEDGVTRRTARLTERDATHGALATLADRDLDGLPDGWEGLYGLDPGRDDAGDDTDGDGRTNAEEYRALTQPAARTTVRHDEAIALRLEREGADSSSSSLVASFAVYPTVTIGDVGARQSTVTVHLEGAARWGYSPYGCSQTRRTLSCQISWPTDEGTDDPAPITFEVEAERETDVTLRANLGPSPYDDNPGNDSVELVHRLRMPVPVISATAPAVDYVLRGESSSVSAYFAFEEAVLPGRMEVVLVPSPEIEIESASFEGSDGRSPLGGPCRIEEVVRCEADDVNGRRSMQVDVRYRIRRGHGHTLRWKAVYIAPNGVTTEAGTAMRSFSAKPVSDIQWLVNSAPPGTRVDLPEGVYYGALDGRDKSLHVRGATTGRRTVIVHERREPALVLKDVGDGSLYEHIDFKVHARVTDLEPNERLAIANSDIAPSYQHRHLLDGLFGRSGRHGGVLDLVNTRIHGFGRGRGDWCGHLFLPGRHHRVTVSHGVFEDNACAVARLSDSGTLSNNDPAVDRDIREPYLSITNGTFVGNDTLFRVGAHEHTRAVRLEKSIVVGTSPLVQGPEEPRAVGLVLTDRNLLVDSEWGPSAQRASREFVRFDVESPDLAFDPAFVDREGGDYRLSPASAAIDQGGPTLGTRYRSATQFDIDGETVAVDGLGDGVNSFDLGAFEYGP